MLVKHRQLARQVEVFIENPLENSMALFKFTSAMLPKGTTFVFGSWVCVTDGVGDFHRHLADTKLKTLAATQRSKLNEFVDDLDKLLLPDLTRDIEELSVSDAMSTRAAPPVTSCLPDAGPAYIWQLF